MTRASVMRELYALLLIASAFFLIACHRIPKISDYPTSGLVLQPAEAERFVSDMEAKSAEVTSLRMLSRCEVSHEKSRFASRYAFVAEKDGGLRIEQLPLAGFYALATLVSSNAKTTVIFPSEKRALIFAQGGDALKAMLGLDLPFNEDDIGVILSGDIPGRFLGNAGQIHLNLMDEKIILKNDLLFAELNANLVVSDLHFFEPENGKEQVYLHFDYDEQRLPKLIRIQIPEHQVMLTCDSQSRALNAPLSEKIFSIEIPSGFSVSDERSL